MGTDGSGPLTLVSTHQNAINPVWAPGDGQIAFAWNAGGTGDYEIWKMNEDGTGQAKVTDNTYEDIEPTWGAGVLP